MTQPGDDTSATLLPDQASRVLNPAIVRSTPTQTVLRDGRGRRTRLVHGRDVDRLVLRRTPTPRGGVVWTLDFMRGAESRARLHAPPWGFDRTYGPAQLSAVSGLPLEQKAPMAEHPAPAMRADARERMGGPLLLVGYAGELVFAVDVVFGDSSNPWLVIGLAAMAAALAAYRIRTLVLGRATVVFRARPGGPVPRGFGRGARIERTGEALRVRTHLQTLTLPLPGDACGPSQLRPASRGHDGEVVVVRTSSGRDLVALPRRDWCGGRPGSETDLAAAIDLRYDDELGRHDGPQVPTGVGSFRVGDDRPFTMGLLSAWTVVAAASGDVHLLSVASVLAVVALLLGPVWEIAWTVRAWWWSRPVHAVESGGAR